MATSMVRQFLGRLPLRSLPCLQKNPPLRSPLTSQPFRSPSSKNLTTCTRPVVSNLSLQQTQIQPVQPITSPLLRACQPFMNSARTLVRYSIRRGKPKPNRAVIGRFFRLGWGIYIRPRAGRSKRLWTKPDWIVQRGKNHVFCNKQQSKMLDKMTTRYWKKRRYYVDDPYEVYHQRAGKAGHERPRFFP